MQSSVLGVNNDRYKSGDDPRPWPQSIMRNVEPQCRTQRVLFIFRAEHSLRYVSSASRLSARIPCQPPLHSQINDERQYRQSPKRVAYQSLTEVGEECRWIRSSNAGGLHVAADGLQVRFEDMHAADLSHRNPGEYDNHRH